MKQKLYRVEAMRTFFRLRMNKLRKRLYLATSPDVPGLIAQGRSITETLEMAQGVVRKVVESCLEHGDSLPPLFRSARSVLL